MAAVESRELVGAAHSPRITQMRRGREPHDEREQKAEQNLEDARTIAEGSTASAVALDAGRRFTESCERPRRPGAAMLIRTYLMLARNRMLGGARQFQRTLACRLVA
jgi:hypothetical protein